MLEMHVYTTHDRALIDRRRNRVESGYWPVLLPLGGELRFLVRKVTTGRGSVVRWSSRLLGRGIHVSPMSDTWLRMHEAEHSKHESDV
ncbi:MAG TPA: hypothetical protein VIK60_14240 [Vicinamibacterales bacterium]